MSSLDSTLGALFAGLILSSVLHGVTLAQAWFYFSSQGGKKSDRLWIQALVGVVVVVDFLHQLFTTIWIYTLCVTHFGDTEALGVLPWSYYGMAYPTGAVTVLVQGFYVYRIYLLSRNVYFSVAVWSLSLAQLGSFLYYVARVFHIKAAADLSTTLKPYVIVVNGLGASTDVVIALAMVLLLTQAQTHIRRTNRVLRSLVIFSVTTGIVSSVCAILVLSMAIAFPSTNILLTFYFTLTRLYANSLLATLNVRDHLRERAAGTSNIITTFLRTRRRSFELEDLPDHEQTNSNFNITQNFNKSATLQPSNGGETVVSVTVDRMVREDSPDPK